MNMTVFNYERRPANPLREAVEALKARGYSVETTDIPGLLRVNGGPELTIAQFFSLANELSQA